MRSTQPDLDTLARARREIEGLAAATRALSAASDVGPALARHRDAGADRAPTSPT